MNHDFKERYLELKGEIKSLSNQLSKKVKNKTELEEKNRLLQKSIDYAESFMNQIISNKKQFIEDFINQALQVCLGEAAPKFSILREDKPSGTIWSYEISQGKISGGIDTFGGGVMALISTLFRIILHIILNKEPFIILDESLNHLSSNYHHKLSLFFKKVAREYNISIILITHQSEFLNSSDINLILDKQNGELILIKEEHNGTGG